MTLRIAVAAGLLRAGILYIAASLTDCLQAAYGVKRYQIAGPDWLSSQRYNISARTAVAASEEQITRRQERGEIESGRSVRLRCRIQL